MDLLGHLCNRERKAGTAHRNVPLPSAAEEASRNKEPSPVPVESAGEGSRKLVAGEPAEQLAALVKKHGDLWAVSRKLGISYYHLMHLHTGETDQLPDVDQARRLREAAESRYGQA